MHRDLCWAPAGGSDAPSKPEEPITAKPQLSADTGSQPAASGQADELRTLSLTHKLKLRGRGGETGHTETSLVVKDLLKPESELIICNKLITQDMKIQQQT